VESQTRPETKNISDLKILIIEDDSFIRISLCGILRPLKCKVFTAEDGARGVELFKIERPDIVMSDILMPHKEGVETIAEIRACDSQVKIIAMSGGGNTRNMNFLKLAEKAGADLSIQKPFTPAQVRKVIEDVLRGFNR
jgi:DNA-binding response OmpR family regulator